MSLLQYGFIKLFCTVPSHFPPQSWSTTIKPVWEAGEVWNFHFSTGLGMLWGEGEELSLLQVSNDVSSVRCCLPLTGDVAGHELPVLTFQALHRLMFQMLFQRHYKEDPPTCEQGDQWTGSFQWAPYETRIDVLGLGPGSMAAVWVWLS